jgi:hypothetical protein
MIKSIGLLAVLAIASGMQTRNVGDVVTYDWGNATVMNVDNTSMCFKTSTPMPTSTWHWTWSSDDPEESLETVGNDTWLTMFWTPGYWTEKHNHNETCTFGCQKCFEACQKEPNMTAACCDEDSCCCYSQPGVECDTNVNCQMNYC